MLMYFFFGGGGWREIFLLQVVFLERSSLSFGILTGAYSLKKSNLYLDEWFLYFDIAALQVLVLV
jgi:hypothetical protein